MNSLNSSGSCFFKFLLFGNNNLRFIHLGSFSRNDIKHCNVTIIHHISFRQVHTPLPPLSNDNMPFINHINIVTMPVKDGGLVQMMLGHHERQTSFKEWCLSAEWPNYKICPPFFTGIYADIEKVK